MPTGGGGSFVGGSVPNPTTFGSSVQISSLGVGQAADGTPGDLVLKNGYVTGGNTPLPAVSGDVFVARASTPVIGVILIGNNAATPSGTIQAGVVDAGANATTTINGAQGLTVGNVYTQVRHGLVFSNLPAAAASYEGAVASITDSTTAVWGATITGGGGNHVLAYCDGTNWKVAAI
ncbi:MAG TPA: hypothetical protein VGI65_00720 [Steroidobacteraceae bacterium]|jgi:hypothetical protein